MIDVNSGSFIGRGKGAGLEDTITKTNLEAAEEVVNQLRLRDIGGIIVIDFIDMARARNRDAVMKTLRKTLDEDRTKTFTAEISKLGLVEMTRQNVTEGVREIMSRPCPTCEGEGVIRSEETIAIEFERRLRDVAAEHPDAEAFLVQINPRVTAAVHRPRLARAARARGADRQVVPVRGLRRARARPLRDHLPGHARGGRGARAAVPPGRRGARRDRRAAHVRRRRRGRENRRLHHLDRRRRRRTSARSGWCASTRSGARRRARCCSTSPARSSRAPRARARARARNGAAPAARPADAPARRRSRVARARPARAGRQRGRRGAPRSRAAASRRRRSTPSPRRSRRRRRDADDAPTARSRTRATEDGLQSKPRRRGRRGGRRRSAAKAKATPE